MIHLDSRIGSAELEPLFKPYGLTVEKEQLPAGDVSWDGRGPGGRQVAVTVERKGIDDLLQSWTSGRLSGLQLKEMHRAYDYAYLVVEGIWKPGPGGEVLVQHGRGHWYPRRIQCQALNNYLMGLTLRAGVVVWRTATKEETVAWLCDQYRMWQQPWESHTSHQSIYSPALMSGDPNGRRIHLVERKVTLAEDWAYRLPRIGEKMAKRVAQVFKSGRRLAESRMDQWMGIEGVGRETAARVREAIEREDYEL